MSTVQPSKAPEKINAQDIITLTARLAQLLAEEVDHLSAMKVAKIQELQKEKQFLTSALEAHRKQLAQYPHLAETIPSRDRKDMEAVVKVLEDILEENHRRLLLAREVNLKVVEAITEVVRESSKSKVYNVSGMAGGLGNENLSITLNQTA